MASGQTAAASPSAWAPLREPLFRALWIAAFASNIGTWMQNVAAAWLMTSLTSSATLVALDQRTIRRYLSTANAVGFGVVTKGGCYELASPPVRDEEEESR